GPGPAPARGRRSRPAAVRPPAAAARHRRDLAAVLLGRPPRLSCAGAGLSGTGARKSAEVRCDELVDELADPFDRGAHDLARLEELRGLPAGADTAGGAG